MNKLSLVAISFFFVAGSFDAPCVTAQQDLFDDQLMTRQGTRMRVELVTEPRKENGKTFYVFRTPSGGLLKLQKNRTIQSITAADSITQEYLRLKAVMDAKPDDAEAHWDMYEWCRAQPKASSRFKQEMEFHLRQIIKLDPNDVEAHKLLGYDDRFNGVWVLMNC